MKELTKLVSAVEVVSLEHAEHKLAEAKTTLDIAANHQRKIVRALNYVHPTDETQFDEVAPFASENNVAMAQAYSAYQFWCDAVNDLRLRAISLRAKKGQG